MKFPVTQKAGFIPVFAHDRVKPMLVTYLKKV
jgi:hypothetical protein